MRLWRSGTRGGRKLGCLTYWSIGGLMQKRSREMRLSLYWSLLRCQPRSTAAYLISAQIPALENFQRAPSSDLVVQRRRQNLTGRCRYP